MLSGRVRDQLSKPLSKPLLQLLLRLRFAGADIAVFSSGWFAAVEVRASLRASRPRAWHQLAMEKITPAEKRQECLEFPSCIVARTAVFVRELLLWC